MLSFLGQIAAELSSNPSYSLAFLLSEKPFYRTHYSGGGLLTG